MSIIKRKAGSEDIVKSVLEFDAVPTEGSPNLVESGAVAQAIGNLGQPLQWKGPATVAELNTGISGIQPGWTYTLTDAGTLTDGSIVVDVGDEVAWTEDGEWFKVGGDSSIKTFNVVYDTDHYTWPTYSQVFAALDAGKSVAMVQTVHMVGSKVVFWLQTFVTGSPAYYYFVSESYNGAIKYVKIYNNGTVVTDIGGIAVNVIADEYDATATYVVGDVVMHGGQRYSCSTAITTPEAWDSSHWAATSIQDSIGDALDKLSDSKTFSFTLNSRFSSYFGTNYLTIAIFNNGCKKFYGLLNVVSSFTPSYSSSDEHILNGWIYLGKFSIPGLKYFGQPFNNFTYNDGTIATYFTLVPYEEDEEIAVFIKSNTLSNGDIIPLNTLFV